MALKMVSPHYKIFQLIMRTLINSKFFHCEFEYENQLKNFQI